MVARLFRGKRSASVEGIYDFMVLFLVVCADQGFELGKLLVDSRLVLRELKALLTKFRLQIFYLSVVTLDHLFKVLNLFCLVIDVTW